MQDQPTATQLLEAIADFLLKEVLPVVQDDEALAYKTLVSWNMLGVVGREIRQGRLLLEQERNRLAPFFPDPSGPPGHQPDRLPDHFPGAADDLEKQVQRYNELLAARIRSQGLSIQDRPVWDAVKASVRERIVVTNPRFALD
ncbi:MAG: hypothetical protein HS115_14595 [Spirochaetales bacterium]|nr:hypothetical protein [Spirochaetales bacterium]